MNENDCEQKVKECYSTWSRSYYQDYHGKNAAYPPVQREILKKILHDNKPKSLLDAGCGPASILRELTGMGIDLYGFDLTPEMVIEAQKIMGEKGYAKNHIWQGSVLSQGAFQPPSQKDAIQFEAVVCMGVLPHIPAEKDTEVLNNLKGVTAKGGVVVVEARNQLFSLFTFNRYSRDFLFQDLIRMDDLLEKANDEESDKLKDVCARAEKHFRLDLPPVRGGKEDEPGYDEVLSRTHNPLVLKKQAESAGLADVEILYYHYHRLPPMFEEEFPEFFRKTSLEMERPDDWRGMLMASAFLLVGRNK